MFQIYYKNILIGKNFFCPFPQKGGNCVGLSDLHLVDQLCIYMNGGPKSLVAMETTSGESHLVLVGNPCH